MVRTRQTRTGDLAPVVIPDGEKTRTVEMVWGLEPSEPRRRPRFLARDDSPNIDNYCRCIIPATALPLTDREGGKWIVTLKEAGAIFCFAGVWQQARDTWPDAYAAVTVPAYPDLKFIKRRHVAILARDSWVQWLAGAAATSILIPLPRRSLTVVPK
jgi:putative SOS response-associated peptidase YedK